jgi:hypothetical protein
MPAGCPSCESTQFTLINQRVINARRTNTDSEYREI